MRVCSLFVKKTSTKPDGVAVFWNEKKLKVKESIEVSLDVPNGDESGKECIAQELLPATAQKDTRLIILRRFLTDIDHELLSRSSQRGSVGAVVHFEHIDTPLDFVVATTHLFWDPMQEDVKLLQSRRMLRTIEAFISALDASTPTIFSGDFNSLPDSKVYNFITKSNHFNSAYSQYGPDGEPPFTNVNGDAKTDDGKLVPRFVGTLDYIFYRSARYVLPFIRLPFSSTNQRIRFPTPRMRPAALMEIMSFEDASKEVALPSTISPSDHLPLLCEFHILPPSN
ncbi:unnamed protein product [Phytophthora fragariaefolia]|uniref:Unnamed protein product n=1 Tax=Phytophthora fragariaefolia TaxID=1490495 RepID=A0A9W7DAN2_9STRA|nr:unnamed protein product [Phytophthora fragariaefolia]